MPIYITKYVSCVQCIYLIRKTSSIRGKKRFSFQKRKDVQGKKNKIAPIAMMKSEHASLVVIHFFVLYYRSLNLFRSCKIRYSLAVL